MKQTPRDQPAVIKPSDNGSATKDLIPIKIESADLVITIKYTDHTALISSLTSNQGDDFLLTFGSRQPKKIERYKNHKVFNFSDYYYTGDKITKVASFDQKDIVYTPVGHYKLEYATQNLLTGIKYFGADNKLFLEKKFVYNNTDNITSVDVSAPSGASQLFQFTYDKKNGLFKNVPYAMLLMMEAGYDFLYFSVNNVTGSTTANNENNVTYSYLYNSDNYPSQMTVLTNNKKEIFKITYVELQP